MIPILYDKNETEFTSNGLGRLYDCISCIVTEERNGIYECDFEYPITGAHYEDIQVGRIIGVSHGDATSSRPIGFIGELTDEQSDVLTDENGLALSATMTRTETDFDVQPFDIVSYTKPIDGVVTFHCTHISYRQCYIVTLPAFGAGTINSLADAFHMLETWTVPVGNPFSYWTNKSSTGYLSCADGMPRSIRSVLGGIEGSILDAYGGEYEWDKWTVKLWASRGQVRDFQIRYGVNMLDYNEEYDIQGTYSSCMPYWTDGVQIALCPRVASDGMPITGREQCVPLDLSDKFETFPDVGQLQQAAKAYLDSHNPYIPQQNIHVEFARLQDLGYEEYEKLLECNLCDTITVIFPDYHSSAQYKIVKTVWDALRDKYESMELGDLSVTLAEALGISSESSRTSDMTDFVVEQATSDIWTYRKWNSGIAECWGEKSLGTKAITSAYGNAYYASADTVTFPSGLFTSNPVVEITTAGAGGYGLWFDMSTLSTASFAGYMYSTASCTTSVSLQTHAIGRWK